LSLVDSLGIDYEQRGILKQLFLIGIGLILVTKVSASEFDSLNTLRELIPDITLKESNTQKIVEYCPDNTCNIIKAPKNISNQTLGDFSFLYLYYASGCIHLIKSYDNSVPFHESARKYTPIVMAKYKHLCKGDELETASCIMLKLAKQNNIQLYFSRYDEGHKSTTYESNDDSLRTERLREIKKWLGSQ